MTLKKKITVPHPSSKIRQPDIRDQLTDLIVYSYSKVQTHKIHHRSETYILKPTTGCRGTGIYLAKSLKKINRYEQMVCQLYVSTVNINQKYNTTLYYIARFIREDKYVKFRFDFTINIRFSRCCWTATNLTYVCTL